MKGLYGAARNTFSQGMHVHPFPHAFPNPSHLIVGRNESWKIVTL